MSDMPIETVKVDRVDRQVIEGKLLESLDDGAHVAIVLSQKELKELIVMVRHFATTKMMSTSDAWARGRKLEADLTRLHLEAFGEI